MRTTQFPYVRSFAAMCSLALALWSLASAYSDTGSSAKPPDRIAVLAEAGAVAELVADGLRQEAKLPAVVVDADTLEIAVKETRARYVVNSSHVWDARTDERQELPDLAEPGERAAAIVKGVGFRAGRSLSERGREAIIRRAGSNADALSAWAQSRASMRAGNIADAEKSARRAVELGPQEAYAHAQLSIVLSAKFATKEALAAAQQALVLDGASPLALHANATALDYSNDLAAAAKAYEQVLTATPHEFAALSNLGLIRFNHDYDFASATELFERASYANPTRIEPLVNLARAYGEVGKSDEAIELLTEAKAQAPMNSLVRMYLAEALGRAGKHSAALAELDGLPDDKHAFEAAHFSGAISLAAGDLDSATRQANVAIAKRPTNIDAMHLLGRISEQAGDDASARQHYQQAITTEPRRARRARRDLAILLSRSGDHEGASKLLDESLQFNERDGEAHYNRGILFQATSNDAEARSSFEQAFELAPYLSAAAYNAGVLAERAGDLAKAELWLRKAVAAQADDLQARLALGIVLGKRGDWPEAQSLLESASRSKDIDVRERAEESLALVLQGAGQVDAARPKLEALLKRTDLSNDRRAAIDRLLGR